MNFTSVTDFKQISIEKHDSPSYGIYSSTWFQHNFSKVKPLKDLKNWNYAYQLEDISWNVTKWYFRVVANVPDFTDYNFSRIIYTINNKIADWSDYHEVKLILEDKYQNPIIDVDWVKNMEVKIWFNDKVRTNQFENSSTYDAIVYTSSGFININQAKNGIATSTNDNWEYIVKLKSYAPTTTSSNDKIKLNSLTVNVTATWDNSWVWEIIWEQSIISASNYNFDFEPTHTIENIKLYNIWGIDWWITYHEINGSQEITVWYDYEFSWSIIEKGNATISNMKILNILDIENSESESFNDEIVFQNLTWGIFDSLNNRFRNSCNSYRKIWSVYHLEYFNSDYCSKFAWSGSSTIYLEFDDSTSNDNLSFYATPNILWEDIFSEGVVHYSSYISYQNGDKYVIYPSSISPQDINMTNRNIKIAWTINNKYIYDRVVIWEVLDTTLSKTEMRKNVVKNVNNVLKNKNNIPSNIKYSSWNLTLNSSLPSGIDTIIVEWWDLIINWDILKQDANKLNSIIVLKDSNWNGWNLWINKNVKFISAIIFVDGAIFSWNSEYYWSDTGEAVNQLFIKWSIISNNTIWWALLSNELKCPYVYEWNCDKQAAKRYDFYFFRHFNWMSEETKISSGVYGFDYVDMTKDWYSWALMIIEYDSKIKTNPPSWFLIK
jgi:hypothetical protein